MADVLLRAAMWLGALCAGAILIGGLLAFARWLVAASLSTAWLALWSLVRFIVLSSRRLAGLLQLATLFVVVGLWRLLRRALRQAAAGARTQALRLVARLRDGMRRPASSDAPGTGEADEESWSREEATGGGEPASDEIDPERAAYEQALDILGLRKVQRLTRIDLKKRHGELMSVLHPDKGFPNHQFAQAVNDAVATVKRYHNWR